MISTPATRSLYCAAGVALVLSVFLSSIALAQPASEESAGDDKKDSVLREQTIYVPYSKLRDSFEKNGRGVFLPYDQFQALWKAARAVERRVPDEGPPVGAVITEIESKATIDEDVISVDASLKIELLTDGWHEIPLRLNNAAIAEAQLNGQPARLIGKNGYKLLVKKEKNGPKKIELSLQYSKAYTKAPGQNSVAIEAPQAAVNRWQIRIPEAGVKVNVKPMIAAAEVPNKDESDAKETVVMAFLGAAPMVRIDWTPKAEGALGLAALATVQAEQQVTLDQGVVRTRSQLQYEITRADLSQLRIEVPADQKVAGVFDANVRQWDVKTEGETQQITIQLFQPTRGKQNLTVELEKFVGEFEKKQFVVPVVQALDVGRQQGIVVVRLGAGLRAEGISRSGLLQLDASELPRRIGPDRWNFAYRYAALPFDLKMDVEKIQPRVVADQLVEVYLEPDKLTLDLLVLYNIEKAGLFQFDIDIPAGYQVRRVSGRAAPGATPVHVDNYDVDEDDKTKLIVNLARKAIGKVGLFLELEKRLKDPNLLSPTGKASEMKLPIPRVAPASVERSTGRLVICKPESLKVNPLKQEGLRSISFAAAYQKIPTCRDKRFPKAKPSLAFAFTDQAVSLVVQAERRKPHITVRQLLTVEIKSGQVKYVSRFYYLIRYSGVESLRLDVPADLIEKMNNTTPAIRQVRMQTQPKDVGEGYVAMELAGETELLGEVVVGFEWEQNMSDLEVGKPVSIVVPSLKPSGVDLAWGQIVVAKSETIDVRPSEVDRLRPVDPQHDIEQKDRLEGAALAFEFYDDWKLILEATRYKLEAVKRTSIEMGVVRQVITRSGQVAVQARYRMRSARQRIKLVLPTNNENKPEFDAQPVRINGQSVPLESGGKDNYYIPLVGLDAKDTFLLELNYTQTGSARDLQVPSFPDEPAVQNVYLCAYVPDEQVLLGVSGPWTNQQPPWWRFHPLSNSRKRVKKLLEEVATGTKQKGNITDTFSVAGQLYLFSTLQPPGGKKGALCLVTMNENWFQAIVFIAVLAIGLVMIRRRVSEKFTALAVLVIALILMGVFLPTLSGEVLRGVLFWALAIVLILWGVWFVIRDLPRLASRRNPPRGDVVTAGIAADAPPGAEEGEIPGETEKQGEEKSSESPPELEPEEGSDGDDGDEPSGGSSEGGRADG